MKFLDIFGKLFGNFPEKSWNFPETIRNNCGKFPGISRTRPPRKFFGIFWEFQWNLQELPTITLLNISWNLPDIFWTCSTHRPDIFHTFSGHVPCIFHTFSRKCSWHVPAVFNSFVSLALVWITSFYYLVPPVIIVVAPFQVLIAYREFMNISSFCFSFWYHNPSIWW